MSPKETSFETLDDNLAEEVLATALGGCGTYLEKERA